MQLKPFLAVLVGAIILMAFGFFDGYPIVTNDTGTYVNSGYNLIPPDDRPIFYGLFVRGASLQMSLWLPVFFQSLMLSFLIRLFFIKGLPGISNIRLAGIYMLISVFTLAGWYVSQVTPDIFVSITILAVIILLLFPLRGFEKAATWVILGVSILMHSSNYVMATGFALLLLLLGLRFASIRQHTRTLLAVLVLSIGSWLALCTSNYLGNKGFTSSNATHVFILGKWSENGILQKYLNESCTNQNYQICRFKDSLPQVAWEFHWKANSPVSQTGGWEANKTEYNKIIKEVLSSPKYYPLLIFKSMESAARQGVLLNIDGSYSLPWMIFDAGTPPFEAIKEHYGHELSEFSQSRQNVKTLNLEFINNGTTLILLGSLLVMLFLLPATLKNEAYQAYFFLILFLFLNAFITSNLSSINERLNSRVMWLVSFINFYFIYKSLIIKRNTQDCPV
ncbi:MAG: hypothetical protein EOP49_10725 [Sphingobacteriales bacterium]|nr:MAG: hypothetical protein EOP49_10725 [Sphingobacteriales bacterium]